MRKLLLIVLVIAVLWFGGSWCVSRLSSGMGSINTPEATSKAAIMSLETLEPAKVQAYFTPIPGQLMANKLARTYLNLKALDVQNLRVMVVSEEGSAARVEAAYDMVLTSQLGALSTEHCAKTIKLIQQDKKWYINEAF